MIACYGMPVGRTVFETVLFIGRLQEIFDSISGVSHTLVYRKKVGAHVCRDLVKKKIKDSHVRQAMINRFGEPGTKQSPGATYGISKDVWSALAIAAYVHDQEN
jgi:hypothetical protein